MGFSSDGPIVRISKGIGYATALLTLIFGMTRTLDSDSGYFARKNQLRRFIAASFERAGKSSEALTDYLQVKTQFVQESRKRPIYRENYIQTAEDANRRLSTGSGNR